MMRLFAGLIIVAAASALFGDFSDHPVVSRAAAGGCYQIWAESQRMDGRFRHLVHVKNDCDHWLECTVWTDANPQPPQMLSVGPGMTEQAETSDDSQEESPKAFGTCREK